MLRESAMSLSCDVLTWRGLKIRPKTGEGNRGEGGEDEGKGDRWWIAAEQVDEGKGKEEGQRK